MGKGWEVVEKYLKFRDFNLMIFSSSLDLCNFIKPFIQNINIYIHATIFTYGILYFQQTKNLFLCIILKLFLERKSIFVLNNFLNWIRNSLMYLLLPIRKKDAFLQIIPKRPLGSDVSTELQKAALHSACDIWHKMSSSNTWNI